MTFWNMLVTLSITWGENATEPLLDPKRSEVGLGDICAIAPKMSSQERFEMSSLITRPLKVPLVSVGFSLGRARRTLSAVPSNAYVQNQRKIFRSDLRCL